MSSLKGLRAVITGASSGIGEDYARQLAERGANLVLIARRKDRLEKLGQELQTRHGVTVECLSIDLCAPNAAQEAFDRSTAGGKRVEILVNNAGIGAYGPFLDRPLDKHKATIQLNLVVLTELCHLFANHMREHGKPGFISNVASIAAYQISPNFAVYCGSKSFVRVFSEALAYELRASNVRVSCLCPGGTWTEFMDQSGQQITKTGSLAMMSSAAVAKIGIDSMIRGTPAIVPGFINKLAAFLPRFFPSRFMVHMAHKTMSRSVNMVEPGSSTAQLPGKSQ